MAVISAEEAVKKLMLHQVVALPTETVYGLAAMINNELALRSIFETKARPLFDPLIVHVENLRQAQSYAYWDDISLAIAEEFWPGPLTIVLPKKDVVSELITSGGSTVALRQPAHPIFQKVLSRLPAPVAAPSANRFGRTSPTCAEHVISEFDNRVDVVDGGECHKGIESTVVEYNMAQKQLKILRPGYIGKKDFDSFFTSKNMEVEVITASQSNAPGFLEKHYQPNVPLYLVFDNDQETAPKEIVEKITNHANIIPVQWELPADPRVAARFLYRDLHEFSKKHLPAYLVVKSHWLEEELWQSLLDRLKKAAHHFVEYQEGQWVLTSKQ